MVNLITISIGSSVTTGKGRFSILVLVILKHWWGFYVILKRRMLALSKEVLRKRAQAWPSLPCQAATAKHWSGNWSTLRRGLTAFSSLDPSPRARHFPFGGGLQSILRLRVSSVRVGAFSTSKIDNGDGPGCSSGSDTLVATFPWSAIIRA